MTTRLGAPPEESGPDPGPPTQHHAPAGVRLRAAALTYPARGRHGRALEALADVTLEVARPRDRRRRRARGCGKSTLLELVCGLQAPDARDASRAAPAVLMPQRDLLLPWLDALDNAALALRIPAPTARARARAARSRCSATFGLEGFERARPDELSGGMRQRVAFLRTLLTRQAGALPRRAVRRARHAHPRRDAATGSRRRWRSEPRTTLLVTHDVEEAAMLADRIVVLSPRPGARAWRCSTCRSRARGAHRPGARRAARARPGGAARVIAALLVLLLLAGAWEAYARLGPVDDFILPAPTQVATALWDDRALLWDNLLGDRPGGRARASSSRSSLGAALADRASTCPRHAAPRRLPAARRLAGRARSSSSRRCSSCGSASGSPRSSRSSRSSASSRSSSRRSTRCAPSTPSSASSCARSTPRAGRRCAGSRRRPRCPARSSGAKIAVAVAVIGAVFAEYAGSSEGLGQRHPPGDPAARDRARLRRRRRCSPLLAILLFALLALAERLLVPWARRPHDRSRA